MSPRLKSAALLLVTALVVSGCAAGWSDEGGLAPPDYASAGIGFYFDDLAPYGTWVEVSPYGWVWYPLDTPVGWRPYTVGYWAYSDDGWLWVSQDPWGWIPYHYGRWTYDRDYGWIWVPGDVWAPAWVAWRYGPGWIGWAPLPPDVYWRPGVGLVYSAYDLDRHIHRYRWCFTPTPKFGTSRVRVTVEPASRNVTLLSQTRNVTKYEAAPRPIEDGMRPDLFRDRSDPPLQRYRLEDSKSPIRTDGVVFQGDVAQVYRPEGGVTQVVQKRVRNVPPAERPKAPTPAVERVRREQTELDERVKAQREQLDAEHQREMRERPPGESAIELKRRQEAELRAQREDEQRLKQELQQRERQVAREKAKGDQKSKPNVAPKRDEPPPQTESPKAQEKVGRDRRTNQNPDDAKQGDDSKQDDGTKQGNPGTTRGR